MRVMLNQQTITLQDRDLLGSGGEAHVYRWQDKAIKLFHQPDTGLGKAERKAAAARLNAKLAKVQAFPQPLPAGVVGPEALVTDDAGKLIGYAMPLVVGGEEFRRLGIRAWREGVISPEAVVTLFRRLHGQLDALHQQGIVVGDLNGSNLLFTGEEPWLIDADSLQFGVHPCPVAHEWYLDPALYGVDLAAKPCFRPENDWYAFTVLLFQSLLYVHPFGGVHATLPTLLRRAEAGHSVLRQDVVYPKAGLSYRILPPELLDWCAGIFDRGERERFPESLLAMRWTTCACGTVHARSSCPDCQVRSPLAKPVLADVHGKCLAKVVFRTSGRILLAVHQGGLKYVYEEGGKVRRETGGIVMTQPLRPNQRFAISGTSTWIGLGSQVVRIHQERLAERCSTTPFGNEAAFDANSLAGYRVDGDWLQNTTAGTRIGSVLGGQTWLRVGEQLGFGFYRAGHYTVFFLFNTKQAGLKPVALPPIDGRLVEVAAWFDRERVLCQYVVAKEGTITSHLAVIDGEGKVRARLSGSPDASRALASCDGKAIVGDRVLVATDQGLLALAVDEGAGTLHEHQLFVDTEPFVSAGSTLLPGPGGSVYVVTSQVITQLTLV